MGPNGESLSLMTPETFVATVTFTDRTASFGYGIDISGERVRLIGVNTPEMKHPTKQVEYFGKEASAFTKRMVEGKLVRREYDSLAGGREQKDRYKLTLTYVFLEDGMAPKRRDHQARLRLRG